MAWAKEWAKEGVKVDWQRLMPPQGFVVLPRRWVVERTFSWIEKNRRTSKLSLLYSPSCLERLSESLGRACSVTLQAATEGLLGHFDSRIPAKSQSERCSHKFWGSLRRGLLRSSLRRPLYQSRRGYEKLPRYGVRIADLPCH
jgi:transposase